MKKPQRVTFEFEEYSVVFDGGKINVRHCQTDGNDELWPILGSVENPWTNRSGKDDGGVMGRKYKPRITDANDVLAIVIKSKKKAKAKR
jgi:hypothetical protein